MTRHKRSFTLAAVLTAARRGPALTAAKLWLPKRLHRGRRGPRVLLDGKAVKAGRARKAVSPKLSGGARRIKVVWKGLKRVRHRKLGRTVVVPVTMKDSRGKQTTLRLRVRRG